MNTVTTANSLSKAIDQHAGGQPKGKRESHDLNSLCARILAPRDVVEKLLSAGILRSEGPVHANDETGMHSFLSDDLNETRRAVLAAVVERTVEESDGAPDQVTLAAGHALREHAAGFAKKAGAKREFSRFPAGLVQLAREYVPEDEPGPLERAAVAGTKVAAAGALAYGAAGYLRGRKPGLSPFDALRSGLKANNADVRRIGGRIGNAITPSAAKVAAVLAGRRPQ